MHTNYDNLFETDTCLLEGKGFIVVKNDTALPHMPGLRRPAHEQKACVAIFHQMHCLVSLARVYS